jgi:FeS assembly SUF system protein
MADEKKSVSLHVAGEDAAAKIMREKIGDVATLSAAPIEATKVEGVAADQRELEEKVIAALQTVYDPEIPLNIYDLGLIYRLAIDAANSVKVEMTLTAPGCPVAGDIVAEVKRKVEAIPEVPRVQVELVWDPPWTRERLSEAARLELGM